MKRAFIIILLQIVAQTAYDASAQDDNDLYRQTISFLKLLTYGEHSQDVGLRFSWHKNDGKWEPAGNGFVFLSDGLGVYDYETEENMEIPIGSLWVTDEKARLADEDDYTMIADEEDVVKFVGADGVMDHRDNNVAPLYIELLKRHNENDSIIPARIIRTIEDEAPGRLDFAAFLDRDDGLMVFRFQNQLPFEVTVYVDNSHYPASRRGVMTQSVFEPGESEVSPTMATIEMKGHVTLPPYSVTFYKFAIRQSK